MISTIKCSICGNNCTTLVCGDRRKSQTRTSMKRQSNYICIECKRKGNGEFRSSFANHQQHKIYFNKED